MVVAAGYLVVATVYMGGEGFIKTSVFLILPMSGIWFPAQLGAYTGGLGRHAITQESPAVAVSLACWVLLLVPIIGYFISRLV